MRPACGRTQPRHSASGLVKNEPEPCQPHRSVSKGISISLRYDFVTRSGLQTVLFPPTMAGMATSSVTLTPEQIEELSKKFSTFRHDVNNNLSLIVAAAELIKYNPASSARMANTLVEQPQKITDHLARFSAEFEKTLGIQKSGH
jgi:hypothetical protein